MLYVINNATTILPGIWSAIVPTHHFDHLPQSSAARARYTVVTAPLSARGDELRLDPAAATILARGTEASILFLDSGPVSPEYPERETPRESDVAVTWRRETDAGFLDACRALVGEDFRDLGHRLLEGFRPIHPGRLLEGKSRKWTNQPSNFVAITIQNRDRSFAVSIRDVPEARNSSLAPRPDRPGYLRFKVSDISEVPEAVRLILASALRSRRP